jgi:hypothetical protein
MALMAMTFPIPTGKTAQWQQFMKELNGPRHQEFTASRKELNARERTFFQQTPHGDVVIVTLEGPNPEASFAQFGQQKTPFGQWFKAQVKEIHGVDLSQPPPGPLPKQIEDSAA